MNIELSLNFKPARRLNLEENVTDNDIEFRTKIEFRARLEIDIRFQFDPV